MAANLMAMLKVLILDQFRQDFAALVLSVKQKLGLRLPNGLNWIIALIVQNNLVFLAAILLENARGTSLLPAAITAILVFNLMLAFTMARQTAVRLRQHPLQQLLWQSPYPQNRTLMVWILAETVMFWLHEMMFTLTAIYVLIRFSPSWLLSIVFTLFWIAGLSAVYATTLYKALIQSWVQTTRSTSASEWLYILRLAVISVLTFMVSSQLLLPFTRNPLPVSLLQDGLQMSLNEITIRFKSILTENMLAAVEFAAHHRLVISVLAVIVLGLFMMPVLGAMFSQIQFRTSCAQLPLDRTESRIFRGYRWAAGRLFPRDPWLERDLILIERTRIHTRLPLRFHWLIPPPVSSILGFSFMLLQALESQSFVICFLFLAMFGLLQASSIWIWNCPYLHPASEIRQIHLTRLSSAYSARDFMRSKTKLLLLLLLPFQLTLTALLIAGIFFLNGSIHEVVRGVLGLWMLFFIAGVLSTWWMAYCSRYDHPNAFAVRMDTYEMKAVQQLYHWPKRLITSVSGAVFFVALFFGDQWDAWLLYSLLAVYFILFLMALYIFNRTRKRGAC